MFLRFATFSALMLWAQTAQAEGSARLNQLFDALHLPELIVVMEEEGLQYGSDISAELLGGRGGISWQQAVAQIYAADRFAEEMKAALEARLDEDQLASLLTFYRDGPGGEIAALETAARRDLLDPEAEAEARNLAAYLKDENDPRYALLIEFSDSNGLVDLNVSGALNASYAFYVGLIASNAFPVDLTDDWESEID